jgi:hypothetical protein
MQTVADWLQNGTYEQGVALYEQHGQNSFLKLKFKAGANDYNVAKLREELLRVAGCEVREASPAVKVTQLATRTQKPILPEPDNSQPDPEKARRYLQLTNKKNKLYQQLNVLMEQKHYLPEGEDLRICAHTILTTHQQIMEAWALIDHYQAHQCFPDDEVQPKPTLEPKKEMQLLRQTISKAKARLSSPTCRDKVQTETLLTTSQIRLAELVAAKPKRK